jgi:hypothetical protein
MSYDLYFYKKNTDKEVHINIKLVDEFFSQNIPYITREDENWIYNNKETSAEFSFIYYNQEDDYEDADDFKFEGFTYTGLTLDIDLGLPEFFGVECFDVVERLIQKLDLYIHDPQKEDNSPEIYTAEELFQTWKENNDWLTRINTIERSL